VGVETEYQQLEVEAVVAVVAQVVLELGRDCLLLPELLIP
jgi:hypothetical protein